MQNIEELKGPIAYVGAAIRNGSYDLIDAYFVCDSEDCDECQTLLLAELESRGWKYEGVIFSKVGTWAVRNADKIDFSKPFNAPAWKVETAYAKAQSAIDALTVALQEAIDQYGQPGGPWNVPSEPGTWIAEARHALEMAKKLQTNG